MRKNVSLLFSFFFSSSLWAAEISPKMARLIGETLTGMPARLGQSNPGVGAVAENLAVEYRDEAAGKTIQARVEEIHDSVVVLRQLSSKGPGKIILRAAYSLEKLQILDQ